MEKTRQEEGEEAGYGEIRRRWRFGGEEFVARMLDQIESSRGQFLLLMVRRADK